MTKQPDHAESNGKSNPACGCFASGRRKYGDKCRFSHVAEGPSPQRLPSPQSPPCSSVVVASTSAPPSAEPGTNDNGPSTTAKRRGPCRFFPQGHCNKGDQCQWSDECKTQEDIMKEEAETTIRQVVLGGSTLVMCGAGMQVERVLCGYECCYISINNLPQDTKHTEIEELFKREGIVLFCVVEMRTLNDKVEANVFVDANAGQTFTGNLNGREFRGKTLDIAVDNDPSPNKMGLSARTDVINVLTVSWRLPTRTFLVHCSDLSNAQWIISHLHNSTYCGRRIQAERSYVNGDPNTVRVSGIPPGVSLDLPAGIYTALFDSTASIDHFDSETFEQDFRRTVEAMAGYETYEVSPAGSNQVNVEVQIRFNSWDNTKRAHDQLLLQPLRAGCPKLFLQFEYSIRIPLAQYQAQEACWDSLHEGDDTKAAFVNITDDNADRVLIRVFGYDKNEVGKLKVQVENLAAGEALDESFWHRSFLGRDGQPILDYISTWSHAYIRCDWKTKSLKVYADGCAKEVALKLLKERVDGLKKSEFSVAIDRDALGFFMHEGLAALKNELGDDAATLEPTPTPRLIIRGGEEAHHIVDRLIEESRTGFQLHEKNGEDACPVCFDDPSSPVLLVCKHAYCSECISHFLVSASDRKQFPLACVGDEDNCGAPISIPLIQRFLSPQQFDRLLEAAVASYIEKRPEQFQYCTTADCKQVYRQGMGAHTCPSCLASICTACNKEAHKGLTCEEREVLDNPTELERRNEQWALNAGAKRCPACRVLVQKTEGCNHMKCRCGVHFCWICLQLFDHSTIYHHLRSAHGGIDTPNVPLQIRANEDDQPAMDARLVRANANEPEADHEYALRFQQEENLLLGLGVDIDVRFQHQIRQPNLRDARQQRRIQRRTRRIQEERRMAEARIIAWQAAMRFAEAEEARRMTEARRFAWQAARQFAEAEEARTFVGAEEGWTFAEVEEAGTLAEEQVRTHRSRCIIM